MQSNNQGQAFLFPSNEPLRDPGNRDTALWEIAQLFADGRLKVPDYQRDFVWKDDKIHQWAVSVMERMSIGVIVTYQVVGEPREHYAMHLADGLQRLKATLQFVKSPKSFGFNFNSDQAMRYCQAFSITVQHRQYKDHWEAMRAFQNLNKGTALKLGELYKGELTLSEVGSFLWERIPASVSLNEYQILDVVRKKRVSQDKLMRDAFGLFMQYIASYKKQTFWDIEKRADTGVSVERELAKLTNGWDIPEAERQLRNFEIFISQQIANLRQLAAQSKGGLKPFQIALIRWSLHLAIWRKNNDRPVQLYNDLIAKMLDSMENQLSYKAAFVLPTDPPQPLGLQMSTLSQLLPLCKAFDVPLHIKSQRTRKPTIPGHHNSHVVSFATNGEGPSLLEPGPPNMARGSKPMTMFEVEALRGNNHSEAPND